MVWTVPASRDDESLPLEILHTGSYLVAAGGERRQVLANLFDAAPSDISRSSRKPPGTGSTTAKAEGLQYPRREIASLLLLAAAALLLVEWLIATRRN